MPRYDFTCPKCGVFEAYGSLDDSTVECACGNTAHRRPFHGIPNIAGETVAHDPRERFEADKRRHEKEWGPVDRSYEMLRKSVVEDKQGHKFVDMKEAK
jgi:putative FmdB family regulatory protein